MDFDFIKRPFNGELFIFRHYGADPLIQKFVYDALGSITTTNDHRGEVDERRITLDAENFRLRCTKSRTEIPEYKCWTLVFTDSIDLQNIQQ